MRSLEKLCVLSQNFCVPSRNFAFSRKTFAFSRKDICVPSQNLKKKNIYERTQKFCEGTQISLRENAKVLRGNAKFLEGTQKFCERTQNIWKIFFPPTLNFFHSLWFFPTTMSFKGLRTSGFYGQNIDVTGLWGLLSSCDFNFIFRHSCLCLNMLIGRLSVNHAVLIAPSYVWVWSRCVVYCFWLSLWWLTV